MILGICVSLAAIALCAYLAHRDMKNFNRYVDLPHTLPCNHTCLLHCRS